MNSLAIFQSLFKAGENSDMYNCNFDLSKDVVVRFKNPDPVLGPDGRLPPHVPAGRETCLPQLKNGIEWLSSFQFDYDNNVEDG